MDESLDRIIRRTLEDARAKGRDRLTQNTLAVRAVCQAHPELTAPEAAAEVRRVLRTMHSLLASVFLLCPPAAYDDDRIGNTVRQIDGNALHVKADIPIALSGSQDKSDALDVISECPQLARSRHWRRRTSGLGRTQKYWTTAHTSGRNLRSPTHEQGGETYVCPAQPQPHISADLDFAWLRCFGLRQR